MELPADIPWVFRGRIPAASDGPPSHRGIPSITCRNIHRTYSSLKIFTSIFSSSTRKISSMTDSKWTNTSRAIPSWPSSDIAAKITPSIVSSDSCGSSFYNNSPSSPTSNHSYTLSLLSIPNTPDSKASSNHSKINRINCGYHKTSTTVTSLWNLCLMGLWILPISTTCFTRRLSRGDKMRGRRTNTNRV